MAPPGIQYFERTALADATNTIEKWVAGGTTYYRTNKIHCIP